MHFFRDLQAARDACDLMGHRKFYDQIIQDTIQQETHKITDEIDITTLKDYMQVSLYIYIYHIIDVNISTLYDNVIFILLPLL